MLSLNQFRRAHIKTKTFNRNLTRAKLPQFWFIAKDAKKRQKQLFFDLIFRVFGVFGGQTCLFYQSFFSFQTASKTAKII